MMAKETRRNGEAPAVSVVIPAWRRPTFLGEAIRSAAAQRGARLEIIVVDDGSPHDIERALPDVACPIAYHRLRQNRGASAARNAGVKLARNEIVAFLDDDDVWLPNKLTRQLPLLERFEACLCGFRTLGGGRQKVHDLEQVTEDRLRRGNYLCGASGLVAWRRAMVSVPFDEALPKGQDWDVFVRLARLGPLGYVPEALFEYRRQSPEGITASSVASDPEVMRRMTRSLVKHREWLGERHFRRRMAGYCLSYLYKRPDFMSAIALSLRHAGVFATARTLAEKAIRAERSY